MDGAWTFEAGATSLLDRPFAVTLFTNYAAKSKHEQHFSLRSLGRQIETATAPQKDDLPWLKLARFGDQRSGKGSLRHDGNLLAITGIEADYDGEELSFEAAVEIATKADLLCLLYTSPSHTPAKPRWRVLCPTAEELPPERRSPLLGRLNGLFRGVFSTESWALSQAYYFGAVGKNPHHRVELVDGTPVDQLHELDAIWEGKPNTTSARGADGTPRQGPLDEAALLEEIRSGQGYHAASVRLLGRWARDGVPYMAARQRLIDAMEAVFPPDRDARWQDRRDDIDRCLDDIYGREARAKDAGHRRVSEAPSAGQGRSRRAPPQEEPDAWPEPIDFLADNTLTGVPDLRPEHIPEALYPFVEDTAARMGVDPASVALAALASCAAVVTDDWRIQPKRHDDTWTESPRLWCAIVGDPSILKSPVISVCTRPIDRLDAASRERYAEALRLHKAELRAWKAEKAPDRDEPKPPRIDRFLVEGTTIEALSEALRDDPEARQRAPAGKVLVRQDEMSEWLAGFDRYRSGSNGSADRGAYLRLYNGGRYTIDRIQRGSFAIPNWSACFIGGIQPGPIQKVAQQAEDDGLLQRFCFCVPGHQAPGQDRAPNRTALERYQGLIEALTTLRPASGICGAPARPVVLAAAAHRHREGSNELAQALSAMPDSSARLQAAYGKWPGLWARLALTFHLIDAADRRARGAGQLGLEVLSEATARRASTYLEQILLPHLLRADAVMYATRQTGHARWIAGHLLARGEPRIAVRDIVQAYGALRAPERRRELLEVMEGLVAMGWVRPEARADLTRPPSAWLVNPQVLERFAAQGAAERSRRQQAQAEMRTLIRKRQQAAR